MSRRFLAIPVIAGLAIVALISSIASRPAHAQGSEPTGETDMVFLVTGTVFDAQGLPVQNALVTLIDLTVDEPLAEDLTQPDGRYAMTLSSPIPDSLGIQIERPHFEAAEVALLHVIETLDLPFEELEDFYGKLQSRATVVMDELAASLSADGIEVEHRIAFGSRVPEILAYAQEMAADVIIVVARPVDPSDPGAAWSGIAYQTAILATTSVLLLK